MYGVPVDQEAEVAGFFFWVDEFIYLQSVGLPPRYAVGLQAKHLPVFSELSKNRLTHYPVLALPLSLSY